MSIALVRLTKRNKLHLFFHAVHNYHCRCIKKGQEDYIYPPVGGVFPENLGGCAGTSWNLYPNSDYIVWFFPTFFHTYPKFDTLFHTQY